MSDGSGVPIGPLSRFRDFIIRTVNPPRPKAGVVRLFAKSDGLYVAKPDGTVGSVGSSLAVQEVDGSPSDSAVTQLIFPNDSLSIASHVATVRQVPYGFIGARAYASAAQSITNATYTAVTMDTELFDSDAFHSTLSNTSRFTIPAGLGGKYLVISQGLWAANATGVYRIQELYKNGSAIGPQINDVNTSATAKPASGFSAVLDLAAGDYLELFVYQDSGGALNFGDNTVVWAGGLTLTKLDSGRVGSGIGAKAIWASGALGAGTYGAVPLNGTEAFDTDGFHSTSVNTSRMTIPAGLGGKYLVIGSFYNGTNETNYGRILKNGSNAEASPIATTGDDAMVNVSTVLDLVAGDYVELGINATTTNNIIAASLTIMRLDSGGPVSGALIGVTSYAPGSQQIYSSTSATLADVDATNALVTFTAPQSGNVLVSAACWVDGSAATLSGYLGLRESTTDIGTPVKVARDAENGYVVTAQFYVTGISAGSHTYKLSFARATTGTLRIIVHNGSPAGPNYGPLVMSVWAAP